MLILTLYIIDIYLYIYIYTKKNILCNDFSFYNRKTFDCYQHICFIDQLLNEASLKEVSYTINQVSLLFEDPMAPANTMKKRRISEFVVKCLK